jgi:membrane-bound lytic murein transglycosylase D
MEPSALRTFFALLFSVLFFQNAKADPSYDPSEIKTRVEGMDCMIQTRYNTTVESYIKKYLSGNARLASRILGRASTYFPIFDEYLDEHKLPQDLKFLAVLESALVPKATSPVGAVGLWQFMAATGRGYGLTIDEEIDERSCPHNSTDAAMKYLAKAYERFGTWELALASYNCGAGTITRAMKRARTEDYWKISQYLPRETRNFVPAFIAVAYIVNYYHLHEIEPNFPSLDMQLTEAVKVYNEVDFTAIAAVTGLPVEVVNELNPAYKKGKVPASEKGHYILLPKRVMPAFDEYLSFLRPDYVPTVPMPELPALVDTSAYRPDEFYFQSNYTVADGDNLKGLGTLFGCSKHSLRAWNHLSSERIKKGQELRLWFPKERVHFLPKESNIDILPEAKQENEPPFRAVKEVPGKLSAQPLKQIKPLSKMAKENGKSAPAKNRPAAPAKNQDTGFIYYQLQRNESLLNVVEKFPGITLKDLLAWNEFSPQKPPMPGTQIKIKMPQEKTTAMK